MTDACDNITFARFATLAVIINVIDISDSTSDLYDYIFGVWSISLEDVVQEFKNQYKQYFMFTSGLFWNYMCFSFSYGM